MNKWLWMAILVLCALPVIAENCQQVPAFRPQSTKIEDLEKQFQNAYLPDDPKIMAEANELAAADARADVGMSFPMDKHEYYRMQMLERKVSGMQEAINRLYARVEKLESK